MHWMLMEHTQWAHSGCKTTTFHKRVCALVTLAVQLHKRWPCTHVCCDCSSSMTTNDVWPCYLAVMHFSSGGARKEGMPIYFWATTPVTTRDQSPKDSMSWEASNLHFFLGGIAQSQGVSMLTCGLVNNDWLVIVHVHLRWVGSKVESTLQLM